MHVTQSTIIPKSLHNNNQLQGNWYCYVLQLGELEEWSRLFTHLCRHSVLIMCSINPTAARQRVGRDALNLWTWSTRGKKEKHEHDEIKLTQLWHTGGSECFVCHAFMRPRVCVHAVYLHRVMKAGDELKRKLVISNAAAERLWGRHSRRRGEGDAVWIQV